MKLTFTSKSGENHLKQIFYQKRTAFTIFRLFEYSNRQAPVRGDVYIIWLLYLKRVGRRAGVKI